MAASGDALVSPAPGCAEGPLLVRRFSRAGAVVLRLDDARPGSSLFDVAGPYVAYEDRERRLVVSDWRTGARLYAVEREALGERDPVALAVQEDGKVATMLGGGTGQCHARVAWASAAEPVPHELPLEACRSGLRVAGDRIAFVRKVPGVRELVTADLSGRDVRPVARNRVPFEGFDFDGGRLAWSAGGCYRDAVYVERVAAPRVAAAPRVDCPLRIGRGPLRLGRDGTVRVPVRCPIGCRIETALLSLSGGEEWAIMFGPTLAPGRGSIVFQLLPEEQRRVRRGGVRVTVVLSVKHPGDRSAERSADLLLRR